MKYAMWSVVTMRTGPNDARRVVWAIGEFIYLFLRIFYIVLTNNLLYIQVVGTGPNDADASFGP